MESCLQNNFVKDLPVEVRCIPIRFHPQAGQSIRQGSTGGSASRLIGSIKALHRPLPGGAKDRQGSYGSPPATPTSPTGEI